jgi:hypothetical protein
LRIKENTMGIVSRGSEFSIDAHAAACYNAWAPPDL